MALLLRLADCLSDPLGHLDHNGEPCSHAEDQAEACFELLEHFETPIERGREWD